MKEQKSRLMLDLESEKSKLEEDIAKLQRNKNVREQGGVSPYREPVTTASTLVSGTV